MSLIRLIINEDIKKFQKKLKFSKFIIFYDMQNHLRYVWLKNVRKRKKY